MALSFWFMSACRLNRPAIPVLLEWLGRVEEDVPAHERTKFREGLVRALGVKEARGVAAPALVREFRRPGLDWTVRWGVGSSLTVVADEAVFDDVVTLARHRSFGRAREMLMPTIARMKDPRVVEILIEMLDDDDVAGQALVAPGKLGAREAAPAIERFVDHPTPWVRKEAKKILARFAA